MKKRRVVNPSGVKRKKRKLSPKQIAIFGTKRQKAALKASRKRRRTNPLTSKQKRTIKYIREKSRGRVKREGNIGEILTVALPGLNPGRVRKGAKSNMARRRRKNRAVVSHRRRVVRRRRRTANPVMRRRRTYRRRSNPKVVVRYRNRRHVGKRYHRRRNPGFGGGTFTTVAGIIGGATVTSILSGVLPASLNTGMVGYLSSAVIAMLQGRMLGKLFRSPSLGNNMAAGGYTFVALKILQDYVPSLYSSLGLRGMGILTPSSFYTPQVNQPGSMASFVTPSAVTAAIPAATGMGRLGNVLNTRRIGRMA